MSFWSRLLGDKSTGRSAPRPPVQQPPVAGVPKVGPNIPPPDWLRMFRSDPNKPLCNKCGNAIHPAPVFAAGDHFAGSVCMKCQKAFCVTCLGQEVDRCPECLGEARSAYTKALMELATDLQVGRSGSSAREYAVAFTFPHNRGEAARQFFEALKRASSTFPFKAKHQVALVDGSAGPFVAVLAQLETQKDESVEVKKTLAQWFEASGAGSYEDDQWLKSPQAGGLKNSITAILGSSYNVRDKFGSL